jgi:hypothetical protein
MFQAILNPFFLKYFQEWHKLLEYRPRSLSAFHEEIMLRAVEEVARLLFEKFNKELNPAV